MKSLARLDLGFQPRPRLTRAGLGMLVVGVVSTVIGRHLVIDPQGLWTVINSKLGTGMAESGFISAMFELAGPFSVMNLKCRKSDVSMNWGRTILPS